MDQSYSLLLSVGLILCLWFIHREEQEKLNVWVALMNLENLYGTQESLVKVFERALQQNEPKKVFFQLIGIYSRTDKLEVRMRQTQGDDMEVGI